MTTLRNDKLFDELQRAPRAWFYRVVWQNGVIDHLTPAKFREIKAAYPGFNREAVHVQKVRLAYQLDHGIKRPISGQ